MSINLEKKPKVKVDELGMTKADWIEMFKYMKPVKRRTRRAKANQSFC